MVKERDILDDITESFVDSFSTLSNEDFIFLLSTEVTEVPETFKTVSARTGIKILGDFKIDDVTAQLAYALKRGMNYVICRELLRYNNSKMLDLSDDTDINYIVISETVEIKDIESVVKIYCDAKVEQVGGKVERVLPVNRALLVQDGSVKMGFVNLQTYVEDDTLFAVVDFRLDLTGFDYTVAEV